MKHIRVRQSVNQNAYVKILIRNRLSRDLHFVLIYPLHGVDPLLLFQPLDEVAVEDRRVQVLQRKFIKVCLQGNVTRNYLQELEAR